jgi:hypothetical protein
MLEKPQTNLKAHIGNLKGTHISMAFFRTRTETISLYTSIDIYLSLYISMCTHTYTHPHTQTHMITHIQNNHTSANSSCYTLKSQHESV